jgi:hypothetical protein
MTAAPQFRDATTRAVLEGLVDYAGLFPPAGLGMAETVLNFARYQRRDDHWALGRLVVPAGRLEEFETALAGLGESDRLGTRWPLTVLLGADYHADLERVATFGERHAHDGPAVLSLEAKAGSPAAVAELRAAVPERYELFLELPLEADLPGLGRAARAAGVMAKVRTGGIRAAEIPAPEAVLAFLAACAAERLPFKATAGLHHPLRGPAPLTYLPGCDTAVLFGYLNVLAAAAALWYRRSSAEAAQWLLADDRREFLLDSEGLGLGTLRLGTAELAATRRGFMRSIGSCSFTEPLDEILTLATGPA